MKKQIQEARKCILLCANCHREFHSGYIQLPENWQSFFDEKRAEELLNENYRVTHHQDKHCPRCGAIISKNAQYCEICARLLSRKADRPSREELKKLIRTMPFTQIATKYGVSDNAIRKWCDSYGLPRKKTEISKISDIDWELL